MMPNLHLWQDVNQRVTELQAPCCRRVVRFCCNVELILVNPSLLVGAVPGFSGESSLFGGEHPPIHKLRLINMGSTLCLLRFGIAWNGLIPVFVRQISRLPSLLHALVDLDEIWKRGKS